MTSSQTSLEMPGPLVGGLRLLPRSFGHVPEPRDATLASAVIASRCPLSHPPRGTRMIVTRVSRPSMMSRGAQAVTAACPGNPESGH